MGSGSTRHADYIDILTTDTDTDDTEAETEEGSAGGEDSIPMASAVYDCKGLSLTGDVRLGFYHTGLSGMCCGDDVKLGGTVFLNMRHIPTQPGGQGGVLIRNKEIDGAEKEKVPKGIHLRIEFSPFEEKASATMIQEEPKEQEEGTLTVGAMTVEEPENV